MKKRAIGLIILIVVILIAGFTFFFLKEDNSKEILVNDFESCFNVGYPVTGINPKICNDGENFWEGEISLCINNCGNGFCDSSACNSDECSCEESSSNCPQDCY